MERFYTDIAELGAALGDDIYLVLSDNLRAFFSFGIKVRTRGSYSHMMWKIPGGLASQNFTFHRAPLDAYQHCVMKFIHNPAWTAEQKGLIMEAIEADLAKPWTKRLYDFLAIPGQLVGCKWIQSSKASICSERIAYLRQIDPEADAWLKVERTPNPTDVNLWTKARQDRYKVFARYSPD